jgi:hypothetical protein
VHYLWGVATPAQVISLGIVTGGLLLLYFLPRVMIKPGQPA